MPETVCPKLKIFRRFGCGGFWEPEYATLPTSTLARLLRAKNDLRLVQVIAALERLTTGR